MATDSISESDLPWKVDLVDWSVPSPEFRERIERQYMVLLEREEPGSDGTRQRSHGGMIAAVG